MLSVGRELDRALSLADYTRRVPDARRASPTRRPDELDVERLEAVGDVGRVIDDGDFVLLDGEGLRQGEANLAAPTIAIRIGRHSRW